MAGKLYQDCRTSAGFIHIRLKINSRLDLLSHRKIIDPQWAIDGCVSASSQWSARRWAAVLGWYEYLISSVDTHIGMDIPGEIDL